MKRTTEAKRSYPLGFDIAIVTATITVEVLSQAPTDHIHIPDHFNDRQLATEVLDRLDELVEQNRP